MNGVGLRIRRATQDDAKRVWEWACDPETRAMSFHSDPIPWSDHSCWYSARLADENSLLLIAEDQGGGPVGIARFEVDGDRAVVGVTVSPIHRGKGLAARLIGMATETLFARYPDVTLVDAFIKPDNTASLRAFSRAGYVPEGTAEVEGQQAHLLVMERV